MTTLAEDWVASIERPDTRINRAAVLNRIADLVSKGKTLATLNWTAITRADVEMLKRNFTERGMREATVRFQLATLRAVLRYHVESGAMDQDALSRIRAVRLPPVASAGHAGRALTRKEIGIILSIGGAKSIERMDRAIFATLVTTGIRASELASIRRDQVQPSGLVRIRGKGGKTRNTWISGPVSYYLDLHAEDWSDGDMLIHNVSSSICMGDPLDRYTVRNSMRRLSAKVDLPSFTPHDLRRTVATILLDEGVDVFIVSDLLGHSAMEVTQLYDRRPDEKKKEAIKKMEAYLEVL
jgi:integrase